MAVALMLRAAEERWGESEAQRESAGGRRTWDARSGRRHCSAWSRGGINWEFPLSVALALILPVSRPVPFLLLRRFLALFLLRLDNTPA